MHRLTIIIGSTRPGRAADRVIPWITSNDTPTSAAAKK